MNDIMKVLVFSAAFTIIGLPALSQEVIEIPHVASYKLVTTSSNGGPTLATGDNFGRSVASIGDINNDGINDVAIGANLDNTGSTDRGAVYICFMNTDGSVKTNPAPVKLASGSANMPTLATSDFFGSAVAGLGDINGDGNEDIAVGANGTDVQNSASGSVYILFLNSSGGIISNGSTQLTNNTNGIPSQTLIASASFGSSIANIGDINKDGVTDIAVGAPGQNGTEGATFILKLRSNGRVRSLKELKENTNGFPNASTDANDNLGFSVALLGDINGDGNNDIVSGCPGDDDGYTDAGALWVLKLDTAGAVINNGHTKLKNPLTSTDYYPNTTSVGFGESVSATDINEDGITDLIAGVKTFNTKGGFMFMVLDENQVIKSIKTTGFNYYWNFAGPTVAPNYGAALCEINLGNASSKQYIVGANMHQVTVAQQGSFYTMTMESLTFNYPEGTSLAGYSKADDFSGNFTGTINNSDFFGIDVAAVGDINSDGNADYVVSAHQNDDGFSNAGAAWVLLMDANGKVSSSNEIRSGTTNFVTLGVDHNLGWGIAPAGDFDNDGVPDFFVGAPGDDQGGGDRGCVYLVRLNSNGTVKSTTKIGHVTGKLDLKDTDKFGIDIDTIGDLDNNGVVDLVVGAYLNDDGGTGTSVNRGAAYVVFLKTDGTVKKSQRISDTQGSFNETFVNSMSFGQSVAGIGDINSDGKEDIAVGSSIDGTGGVHIITLDTSGNCVTYKKINAAGSNFPYALVNAQAFGASIDNIGDVDGNGINDIIIGHQGRQAFGLTSRGGFWITMLDASGNVLDAKLLSDSVGCFYTNTNASYAFGQSAEFAGKDAQGNIKIAFGGRDDAGGTDRGSVFVTKALTFASTGFAKWQPTYYELEKRLDGEYYKIGNKTLQFRYYDKYNDDDNKLTFKIYNAVGAVVYSDASLTLNPNYGENRFTINCGPTGANLPWGNYVLEVINTKKEKYYLRFDLVNPSTIK